MSSISSSLLALIQAANPLAVPLTESDIIFSNPTPSNGVSSEGTVLNTLVTVSAAPNTGYLGQVDVLYQRLDVNQLYGGMQLLSETEPTTNDVISFLNQNPSLTVELQDIELIAIPELNVGDIGSIAITANANSLGVVGNTTVPVLLGLSPNISLLHILVNDTFPTNNYLTSTV